MTTITDAELRALQDWHRRVQGDVPAYVPFLAWHYPGAAPVRDGRQQRLS
jgi:hypothetical protein